MMNRNWICTVNTFVEQSQASVPSAFIKWMPTEFRGELWDWLGPFIVVFGEACRSALDFIKLGNVSGCEWVPCGRCIFKVWSDQGGIGKCFSFRWTRVDVTANKIESLGCLCRYIIDMFMPAEVTLLRQGMGRSPPPSMLPSRVDSVNKVFDVSRIYWGCAISLRCSICQVCDQL